MKPTRRTLLAIALSLPLAVILFTAFACLPAPVGDPEKSKVDESLSGIYQAVPKEAGDKKETTIAILRPWDAKTYLLNYMVVGKDESNKDQHEMQLYKAWLTTIEGKLFITGQPVDDVNFALGADNSEKQPRYWVVLRIDKVPTGLEARMVSPDSAIMKELKTQAEIEAAIKAHVNDKELCGDPITFKKLGKEDKDLIDSVLKQFFTDFSIK
jgi:hypothetical protein